MLTRVRHINAGYDMIGNQIDAVASLRSNGAGGTVDFGGEMDESLAFLDASFLPEMLFM